MARGTEAKNAIFSKLMSVYPNAFWEDEGKILRVPVEENGALIEIKVSLTAAKANLRGSDLPSAFDNAEPAAATTSSPVPVIESNSSSIAPSEEEKANVAKLISALGL